MTIEVGSRASALSGRRVQLQGLSPTQYEWLFRIATDERSAMAWRLRGRVPMYEQFMGMIAQEADLHLVITERSSSAPIGFVQLYKVDLPAGHAALSVLIAPDHQQLGWPVEGVLLFINYAFRVFGLRKLYLESPADVLSTYGRALERYLVEEGRLRDHVQLGSERNDLCILALYRATWFEHAARLLPELMPAVAGVP